MERAPLRPVPARPAGPVDREAALAHVRASLPELDEPAAAALSLADLAGVARPEVAVELGLSAEETAVVLAQARKTLRRAVHPLSGSGWCERAERLISDRLDDALEERGARVLDIHLRRCTRCVEHERRLVSALDDLGVGLAMDPPPVPAPAPPAPELRVVEHDPTADDAAPAEPAATEVRPEPVAAGALSPAAAGGSPADVFWRALTALAILVAVLSVVFAVIGVLSGAL